MIDKMVFLRVSTLCLFFAQGILFAEPLVLAEQSLGTSLKREVEEPDDFDDDDLEPDEVPQIKEKELIVPSGIEKKQI